MEAVRGEGSRRAVNDSGEKGGWVQGSEAGGCGVSFCPVITGRSVLARAWSPLQREALEPSTLPLLGSALSA